MPARIIRIPAQPHSMGVLTDILNDVFEEASGVLASRLVR
jgi:hypothetical protein